MQSNLACSNIWLVGYLLHFIFHVKLFSSNEGGEGVEGVGVQLVVGFEYSPSAVKSSVFKHLASWVSVTFFMSNHFLLMKGGGGGGGGGGAACCGVRVLTKCSQI